jgi:hypothetical protein
MRNIACVCGSVQVRLSGEPAVQFYCHCDDCQASSGGAYVSLALYPADAVTVAKGDLNTWTHKTMPRSRCAVCGTVILAEVPGGTLIAIKANLFPAGEFKPAFHEHCSYAVLPVKDELPHYKGLPPEFGGTDETVDW